MVHKATTRLDTGPSTNSLVLSTDYGSVCKTNIGPSGEEFPAFFFFLEKNYWIQRSQQPAAGLCPDLNESLLFILFPSHKYRVIKNDCQGFNNLSYTIHLRWEYVVAPMDQEILRVFFYDVRCAVVMHFSAWSAVY